MQNNPKHRQPSRFLVAAASVQSWVYGVRRKAATVGAICLAIVMGYYVVFGHNGLTAYQQKRSDTKSLQAQMQDLQRENDRLRGHVERLKFDPGAIEHQAREELHYTRAGEVIYTLPADPKTPIVQSTSKP